MTARQSLALAASATYRGDPASDGLTPRQRTYATQTPPLSAGIVERAFAGIASPRQAIKAKCLTCANWQRENETAGKRRNPEPAAEQTKKEHSESTADASPSARGRR